MSHGGLSHIALGEFLNLEFLCLKQNYIKTIENLEGIFLLSKLKVNSDLMMSLCIYQQMLDLRKNLLSKVEEIPQLILKLVSLKSIGLKGNKFTENKNWRQKLLQLLPEFRETHVELRSIDDEPITVSSFFNNGTDVISVLKLQEDGKYLPKHLQIVLECKL
jgi:hypothetical protein